MITNLDDLAPLAWTQFWQVTAVAIVAGAGARLFGRDRPRLAYALWMLVAVKALSPPIWSSPAGVFSWALAAREPAPTARPVLSPLPVFLSEQPVTPTPADHPIATQSILLGIWGVGLAALLISALGKQAVCSILIRRSGLRVREDCIASLDWSPPTPRGEAKG